jgi:hypothetical protein
VPPPKNMFVRNIIIEDKKEVNLKVYFKLMKNFDLAGYCTDNVAYLFWLM